MPLDIAVKKRPLTPPANVTVVQEKSSNMIRDSIVIAQEIGREMKMEAADALLSVSSEPRDGKKTLESQADEPVGTPKGCDAHEENSVEKKSIDETMKEPISKEETIRISKIDENTASSPSHNLRQCMIPLRFMGKRNSHMNSAGFYSPYPDHMSSLIAMNQRSLGHPIIGPNHQFANNFPYAVPSFPLNYIHYPWHAEGGLSSFDHSRSRNRCSPKMHPIIPKVWSREEISNPPQLPDHSELLNFPPPSRGVPHHRRDCTMCGRKQGFSTNIPPQNRQICTSCDVAIFNINDGSGLEIKYCKGCKRFKAWVEFHDKPMATKCACCRQRERQYYAKKIGDKEGASITIYEDKEMPAMPRSKPSWMQPRERPMIPPVLSHPMFTGRNRCVRLKEPIASAQKKWSEKEKNDSSVPDFNSIVNFNPSFEMKNRCFDDGLRKCVMCGQMRIAAAALKTSSAKLRQGQTQPIIPKQNKGICTECDVAIWVIVSERKEIKFCKGCKNFRTWASFGDRRRATKCERCRSRQRSKYYQKKESSSTLTSEELKNKEKASNHSMKKKQVTVLTDSDNLQSGKENQANR